MHSHGRLLVVAALLRAVKCCDAVGWVIGMEEHQPLSWSQQSMLLTRLVPLPIS